MAPSLSLDARSAPAARPSLIRLALLFWITTFAILALRSELDPNATTALLSPRRLMATTAGALLFWAILHRFERTPRLLRAGPLSLLGMLAGAAVVLLAFRVMFGMAFVAQDVSLAQDVRFTLLWVGYLGLSTGLYLAHRLREGVVAPRAVAAPPADPELASALDWLVDATVAEVDRAAIRDRTDLAERLATRAGYAVADPLAADTTGRRQAIDRVVARLGNPQP